MQKFIGDSPATFVSKSIKQIPTHDTRVLAFKIDGHVDDDEAKILAEYMNNVFDSHEKVNLLFDLSHFDGSDWDSFLDWNVIKSRVRSLSKVDKYAVVGAPDHAAKMIKIFDKMIPVDARTFDQSEVALAWRFVETTPNNVTE